MTFFCFSAALFRVDLSSHYRESPLPLLLSRSWKEERKSLSSLHAPSFFFLSSTLFSFSLSFILSPTFSFILSSFSLDNQDNDHARAPCVLRLLHIGLKKISKGTKNGKKKDNLPQRVGPPFLSLSLSRPFISLPPPFVSRISALSLCESRNVEKLETGKKRGGWKKTTEKEKLLCFFLLGNLFLMNQSRVAGVR